jgi:hypothetical protein
LSRNIHHLTVLLRQDSVWAAEGYREMLDSVTAEVRRHLRIAADALADLRPKHATPIPRLSDEKEHG